MHLEKIGPGKRAPDVVNVIIENPEGENNKYEFDKENNVMRLDRVMYSAVFYPTDYGFVPQTLCEDGDPLDAFVLSTNPIHPGVLVEVRPIGYVKMVDGGERDDKLLCVPLHDARFSHIRELKHVAPHTLEEIAHFLSTYKMLQKKKVQVDEWCNVAAAKKLIQKSIKLFNSAKKHHSPI
jgi:inorganic pyrophosphatase